MNKAVAVVLILAATAVCTETRARDSQEESSPNRLLKNPV